MEASQPQQPTAPPPAPPPPREPGPESAGAGSRVLVGLLALLLAFAAAVMIAVSLDLAEGPRCEQVLAGEEPPDESGECLDASKTAQTISVIFTFASGLAAAVAFLFAGYFVFRGRGGTVIAIATALAIVLGVIGVAVG
jgi:hypothetical protein